MDGLTPGRVVHFVAEREPIHGVLIEHFGARIARVVDSAAGVCTLAVDNPDATPDNNEPPVWMKQNVRFSETQEVGTWHWPERA